MSRVLVLGAGVSGLAAARLARRTGSTVCLYTESAPDNVAVNGFSVATGVWDPLLLEGIDLVVASPGFSERSLPIVETLEAGIPLCSEIEYAWRHLEGPVIAITGTNGKTSVTEATSAMLEASGLSAPATGNIGSPLSDYANESVDVFVVEVSSFQLAFIEEFHPVAAAVTNVAPDHLDWHGSMHSYTSAKARIYANQDGSDLLVYDADDPGATDLVANARSQRYPVSGLKRPPGGGGPVDGSLVVGDIVMNLADLTSTDRSHLANIACATALARRLGASVEGVVSAATSYRTGAHRREAVLEVGGVAWVDDSKATNPHAALASIRAYDSVVLIAGGLAKGLDVLPLASEPNVRMLLGIGEAGPDLVTAAGDRGRLAGTLEIAVEMASQAAVAGDTVLLAPGCASFDQFGSYGERGDRFAELASESQKRVVR